VIQNQRKYQKIGAKSAKFGFLLVVWPCRELRWAFMLIMLWCFFHCDLLWLPSRVCPWEEAQNRLLSHLTESRDGAFNFELKIVKFLYVTPTVQFRWELVCFLSKWYRIRKISKNKNKKCKIKISNSGLTPWWAPLSFRADRVVMFLSLWSDMPS
jgi:hypothetical protein